MSEYRNTNLGSISREIDADIDQGLRTHMLKVYNMMAIGLAITGAASYGLAQAALNNPALFNFIYNTPFKWALVFAPFLVVLYLQFRMHTMSTAKARTVFWIYAGLMGASLSTIFLVYTGASIVKTFFITSASFGALSLYGYTTKRDMSAMGSFLMMGLFGLIIASLVNLYFQSPMVDLVLSAVGVLIFAGLTAYDTQEIKEMYLEHDDEATAGRKAIMGALKLYLDFINLFIYLLRFLGDRK
jgi:uncharacterized protein